MGSEYKIITELLDLQGISVKDFLIDGGKIFITVEHTGYPQCPCCGQMFIEAPKDRRYQVVEDVPVFGKRCYLKVPKRRIACTCGYKGTEYIEWLDTYERYTRRFCEWIYAFCKRMTIIDVARIFGISKHTVRRIDKEWIEKELSQQEELNPTVVSIDEIAHKKGHRYATIITAPKEKKVLEVVEGRRFRDIERFLKGKSKQWCKNVKIVVMDAWLAYRKAIRKYCSRAAICFDHFHLAQHFARVIDKLRVEEAKKVHKEYKDIYKGTRWLLLKRPERLMEAEEATLQKLFAVNERLYKVYVLRDEFRQIFQGETVRSRLLRLDNWIKRAKAVCIPQLTEYVHKIEEWKPYIQNSLRVNCSNGFAEGINAKIRVIQRMAYGYKDFEYFRLKVIQQFNFRDVQSIFDG